MKIKIWYKSILSIIFVLLVCDNIYLQILLNNKLRNINELKEYNNSLVQDSIVQSNNNIFCYDVINKYRNICDTLKEKHNNIFIKYIESQKAYKELIDLEYYD